MSVEENSLDALKDGIFFISTHAVRRMNQRAITAADIRACGRTARNCIYQAQHGTWLIEGEDLDGVMLTVICGIDKGVIIVTIY